MSLLKRRLCPELNRWSHPECHEEVLARPGATNVITSASGEIDLQLSIRRVTLWIQSGPGNDETRRSGIMECGVNPICSAAQFNEFSISDRIFLID